MGGAEVVALITMGYDEALKIMFGGPKQARLYEFIPNWFKKSPYGDFDKKIHEFYDFEKLPPQLAVRLLNGSPNADPISTQNDSPTMREMVIIASTNHGTLEGYVIPPESGRQDARISFTGFTLKVSKPIALDLKKSLRPDEFDQVKPGYWRFWWD